MDVIQDKIDALKRFQKQASQYALDSLMDNETKVLDLNRDWQLQGKGELNDGIKGVDAYGEYHPYTVRIKKEKGQPYKRRTFKDTGAFHESFFLKRNKMSVRFDATDKKKKYLTTYNRGINYDKRVFGLNEESLKVARVLYVLPRLLKEINKI